MLEDPLLDGMEVVNYVIYSDGPSSEFKNKYTMKLVAELAQKVNGIILWKYSATSYGKGFVDSIGGRVKSIVMKKLRSKKR